ncbi:MAG TPA: AbrB/MazE/SpoVT family DNA-binding domain-containing protein [Acidimicrobiales bacterium]|nr:AbrB/MazE/SpoVT family DNA-binding domain-containing protein [Acidimicrobiales bacterium]
MDVTSGVARRIDHLGRIVVPVELRRLFGIEPGDELEISVRDGAITLVKVETRCVFCNADQELVAFRGKRVCSTCAGELSGERWRPAEDASPVGAGEAALTDDVAG